MSIISFKWIHMQSMVLRQKTYYSVYIYERSIILVEISSLSFLVHYLYMTIPSAMFTHYSYVNLQLGNFLHITFTILCSYRVIYNTQRPTSIYIYIYIYPPPHIDLYIYTPPHIELSINIYIYIYIYTHTLGPILV